ncbi:maleylpyruvate isomerase family mycothiol-dependent enzyme [Luedemannella helvata]|uniref:Mycothiol-dependent maleylpyruvate isomerase NagL n=1 Tax=Luedemannella helvata TaxID=349315 RepID=A0ABN2L3C8_9ACTN
MDTRDHEATLPWMRKGTTVFEDAVARLDDAGFAAPSLLPGWTRAHVIGHIARNADGLARLAAWAETGVETPMYASPESRDTEIEASAAVAPAALRADLVASGARLDAALDGLAGDAWDAPVRTLRGELTAAEIPWLRVREVWLHAVDLATGVGLDDLPAPLIDALITDVADRLSESPDCPAVLLVPLDRGETVRFGPGATEPVEVTATAADLLGWVTGRKPIPDLPVTLPRWI